MAYDPRSLGARCDVCRLKGSRVVPPDLRSDSAALFVLAEAPGRFEVEMEMPLVGPSGSEYGRALNAAYRSREETSVSNALLCRPPQNNLKRVITQINRENKALRKAKKPLIPSPLDCCRPRLLTELREHKNKNILLMGATARSVVYGRGQGNDKKLMASRGYPDTLTIAHPDGEERYNVLSAMHPAHVLRARRWTWTFRADVQKAFRMADGTLNWTLPKIRLFPSIDEIAAFLEAHRDTEYVAYDTETDGLEATEAHLRCIGIGTTEDCMIIPWRGINGSAAWNDEQFAELAHLICTWFAHSTGWVCAQNHQYDWLVMERNVPGFKLGRRVLDTAIAHHVLLSELPHSLEFLSAQYSDAPAHKNVNHDAWESDQQLHHYCAIDVAQTANAARKMVAAPSLHRQIKAFQTDMFLSELCCRMHETGLHIDQEVMAQHHERLTTRIDDLAVSIQHATLEALPKAASANAQKFAESFNPSSPQQLRRLLFETYGLTPVPEQSGGMTAGGDFAVGREQLFFMIDRGLPAQVEEILQLIIDYRTATKERSTYCRLQPAADGRVRPGWNPHVVVTGRLSSTKPNVMNIRSALRTIYSCEPGHQLIACDKAQLELRIIAVLAQDIELIEAFLKGLDIHKVNACSIFAINDLTRITKNLRQFAKTFTYAVQYGAGIMRAWRMVKNFRDGAGKRPYTQYSMAEAETNYKGWWAARSAIADYHAVNRKLHEHQGFLADAIDERWRLFLDGSADDSQKEAMANYPIQSTAAADMNAATRRVAEAYPWGFAGPCTGIVHQNHDSLMLEVPDGDALSIGKHVQRLMYSELQNMPLPVDLAIGKSWGALKEVGA